MTVVTAIVPDAKHDGRLIVQLGDDASVVVSAETVSRLGLRVGSDLGGDAQAAIERDASELETYERALNLLAFRARSAAELRRQLLRKRESPSAIDAAIERLLRVGLLDDAAFARQFARAKVLGPGLSTRRLQAELARKGVARDVTDMAIADVMTDEAVDQDAILERAATKKLRTLAKLDRETKRRRLYAFLARRGFDSDDIQRAITRLV